MSLVSFICGLNAVLFLYLAYTFTCETKNCQQIMLRLVFLAVSLGSLALAVGEVLFQYELMAMDSAVPVALATLVNETELLPFKVALTLGGLLLLLGYKRLFFKETKKNNPGLSSF